MQNTMANLPFTRGRLAVNLSPVAYRAQGLQTLGTVESKGETRFLCVDSQGVYWACAEGARPIELNPKRAQDAIGEAATGVKQFTQADRMAANAARREAHAQRVAATEARKALNAKSDIDATTVPATEKTR